MYGISYFYADDFRLPSNATANIWMIPLGPRGRLNKKDGLTGYGDSHVKDKTS